MGRGEGGREREGRRRGSEREIVRGKLDEGGKGCEMGVGYTLKELVSLFCRYDFHDPHSHVLGNDCMRLLHIMLCGKLCTLQY